MKPPFLDVDVDKFFSGPLAHIGVVIKNLVVVLLVLLLYSVAVTKFEIALLSVLLLILLHQVGFQILRRVAQRLHVVGLARTDRCASQARHE